MELALDFCDVFCCGSSEEKKAVIPLDCSIVLPDYFPDVMKILRYTAKTVKLPVFSEGGAETVSGNVNIEVSYVSEEGELCSCSQLRTFSHSFECSGKVSASECSVKVDEIGCRAVNKRRIDLHGNIEISLRLLFGEEKSVLNSAKGAGAVCKNKSEEIIVPVGEFFKTFTVEEKGETEDGMPPVGKIIRTEAFAEISECHVIQDKIVTKGDVNVRILWVPESDEEGENGTFVSDFSYPVSRMTEAEGVLLTDICDARYEADFPEISVFGNGKGFDIKVRTGIFARVYRKETKDYIADIFSSDYESKAEKSVVEVINGAIPVSEKETVYEKFDLPEAVCAVTDMWLEAEEPLLSNEGKIILKAKLCMFAKDSDKNPVYFEKELERSVSIQTGGRKIVFHNLSAVVEKAEFSFEKEGMAEISSSVLIDGTVYTALSTEAVTACSIDMERKIEHRDAALILCYAEKGEEIWEIAKKYGVSPKDIMEENKIEGEFINSKTMLVITQ